MPVDLNRIPAPLDEPPAPRIGRWFALLVLLLLSGIGLTHWRAEANFLDLPDRLWLLGIGIPLGLWGALAFARLLVLIGDQATNDAWNQARDVDLARKLRYGRRSLQVLAVSLRTAFREVGAKHSDAQTQALLSGKRAIAVQADWKNCPEGARHSRLALVPDEKSSDAPSLALATAGLDHLDPTLGRTVLASLQQALNDLAKVLDELPYRQPLTLLLELDLGGSHPDSECLWQALWAASAIRQPVVRLEGQGLEAIDTWLDRCIADEAMLLVVSARLTPIEVAGSAEAVVVLLFGNRLTPSSLPPLAYLHRPQRASEPDAAAWLDAAVQALNWVPLPGASVSHAWLAGQTQGGVRLLPGALEALGGAATDRHDLDAALGNLGCATPWVALAAAVESQRCEQQPHLIFSTDGAASLRQWCAVVMPACASSGKADE